MVDRRIDRDLLRSHICRSPDGHAHGRDRGRIGRCHKRSNDCLGDAEVCDNRRPAGEHHVVGFNVAMYDRVEMRECQGLYDVTQDIDALCDSERSSLQPLVQRLSIDERHDVVRQFPTRARRENRDDVRVVKLRRKVNLPTKTLDVYDALEIRRQQLDRHAARQRQLDRFEHA